MNPALPKSWYYVYLLKGKGTKWIYPAPARRSWIYIGCTSNLRKRLREYNESKVFSTKKMLPVELIYFEAYRSKECAYKREKSLKQYGSGLAKLKRRIG